MAKKIITVIGATGLQGGAVAKIFLNDPKLKDAWQVRGVTRDPSKASAQALVSQGAEMVAGDMNDKASLVKAFTGAHTAFAVTNYWETLSMEKEIEQGKAMADAAKEAGVQHYIWSTLDNIKKMTNGVLSDVYHFDSKAIVDEHIKSIGLPASWFLPGFYMSNVSGGMMFSRKPEPTSPYTMFMPIPPSALAPMFDAGADTGKYVKGMVLGLESGKFKVGGRMLGATNYQTVGSLVDTFKELYPEDGKTAMYVQIGHDDYKGALAAAGFPEHVGLEMLENMRLLDEFGYYGGESLEPSLALVEDKLTTWEEHAKTAEGFAGLK